jgi:hypothetical protein
VSFATAPSRAAAGAAAAAGLSLTRQSLRSASSLSLTTTTGGGGGTSRTLQSRASGRSTPGGAAVAADAKVLPLASHLTAIGVSCGGGACFVLCAASGELWEDELE